MYNLKSSKSGFILVNMSEHTSKYVFTIRDEHVFMHLVLVNYNILAWNNCNTCAVALKTIKLQL